MFIEQSSIDFHHNYWLKRGSKHIGFYLNNGGPNGITTFTRYFAQRKHEGMNQILIDFLGRLIWINVHPMDLTTTVS